MSQPDLDQLLEKIRKTSSLDKNEFRRLYELVGEHFQKVYGANNQLNPCSTEIITKTLIHMASEVTPCAVLNVGMGGYPLADIGFYKMGFKITGIEYSESLINLARECLDSKETPAHLLIADGSALPIKEACFPCAVCSETLEHIPDDAAVLREIHRVLQPSGVLLLTVPSLFPMLEWPRRIRSFMKGLPLVETPSHLREYRLGQIKKLIAPYFKIEKMYPVGFTAKTFAEMPVEKLLSWIVRIPGMKRFSCSIALRLRKI